MQKIVVTGGLGRDAELKQTKSGEDVLTFPIGASQGYGDSKTTNWYRCSIWGKRAQTLAPYIMKGTRVFICGELSIGEYEGKQQLNVRVNDIEFFNDRSEEKADRKTTAHDRAKANGYQPDLNDDVPF